MCETFAETIHELKYAIVKHIDTIMDTKKIMSPPVRCALGEWVDMLKDVVWIESELGLEPVVHPEEDEEEVVEAEYTEEPKHHEKLVRRHEETVVAGRASMHHMR